MAIVNTNTEIIETERLRLRKFTDSDIPDMLQNWIADPAVQSRYGEPTYTDALAVKDLLANWAGQYRWAIVWKKTNENVGQVSFCRLYEADRTAEVEYCIGRAFWNRGIVSEALTAFISYIFAHTPVQTLEAFHQIQNPASGRVLQKAGMMAVENILRFAEQDKPPEGAICYVITKGQFDH